jgi:lipopolysaccharide export system permease protein
MVVTRHINRELLQVFLVTVLVLLVVAVGGRFIGYLQEAAAGRFAADALFGIIALRLPEFTQLLFPFALFFSLLLTVSRLFADQEMTVLLSGGATPARLMGWLLPPILVITGAVGALSLSITPSALVSLESKLVEQRNRRDFQAVSPGVFIVSGQNHRVTYAERMSDDQQTLYNVFISEYPDNEPGVSIWAKRGEQYMDDETRSRFLLLGDGKRYEGNAGEKNFRIIEFEELGQRLDVVVSEMIRLGVEAQETSVLMASDDPKFQAEFHWRLALPLFVLISAIIAVGIAPTKPRQGRFARVVPGMIVFLSYYFLLVFNMNAIASGTLPPIVGMWGVHLPFAVFALWLLMKIGKPARI